MRDGVARARAGEGLAAAAVAFLAVAIVGNLHATAFNNYAFLGNAFVHGRLNVDGAPMRLSVVAFAGHTYVLEPPMPGILMMPFCLFSGINANQPLLAALLLALGAGACWMLLRALGLRARACALFLLVFMFATAAFHGAASGDVWAVGEVSTDAFLFLGLLEIATRNRPVAVAACLFAAAMSRYPLVPVAIGYAAYAFATYGPRYAARYGAALATGLAAFAAYDAARWGTVFDRGYRLYELQHTPHTGPLFALRYLPRNLYFLTQLPPASFKSFPWVAPSDDGIGMIFTGLVFAAALLAPPSRSTFALWGAALVAIAPSLLYYDSGDAQYYNRHFLDCAPFVMVLLARSYRSGHALSIRTLGAFNAACGMLWVLMFRGA